jgi:hypothetical protein
LSTSLKKEKVMLKKITFALILAVLLCTPVRAENFISPSDAQEVAQRLIQRNVAYYLAHPERAGNIPEWKWAAPGDPILVHTYPDMKPCYYVVPVASGEDRIISLIGVSAASREWRWVSGVEIDRFPKVSENQAFRICQQRAKDARVTGPKVVEMPNKNFYWIFSVSDQDLKEIFVNIGDASDVHTNLDPDISDLTSRREPAETGLHIPDIVEKPP